MGLHRAKHETAVKRLAIQGAEDELLLHSLGIDGFGQDFMCSRLVSKSSKLESLCNRALGGSGHLVHGPNTNEGG